MYPSEMKESRVTVIFKGGDINDTMNYRPVCVIPVFSKGLEKVILSRVYKFFNARNICDAQFGLRKGRLTETALLTLNESILQNIENKLFTLGLFIAFSKAFDCLNHNVLTYKLSQSGIRGKPLTLIKSYLEDRKQAVHIDNQQSYFLRVRNGVPQGSVLGPLLFSVYINDIVSIDRTVKFIYADDSSILMSGPNANDLIIKCNEILNKLSVWSTLNYIRINPIKTKVVIYRARNRIVETQHVLRYVDQEVQMVNEHKILGVTFSSNLRWDTHVENICRNLSAVTGVISLPTSSSNKGQTPNILCTA